MTFPLLNRTAALSVAVLIAGCAASNQPTPIRYVALKLPTADIQGSVADEAKQTVSESRMGILYRPPLNLIAQLRALKSEPGSGVLMDVEADLKVPFCVYFFCYGVDTITAANIAPPSIAAAPRPTPPGATEPVKLASVAAPPSAALLPALATAAPPTVIGAQKIRTRTALRNRPTGSADILLHLDAGASVDVVSSMTNAAGSWCYVRANGHAGWINAGELAVASN